MLSFTQNLITKFDFTFDHFQKWNLKKGREKSHLPYSIQNLITKFDSHFDHLKSINMFETQVLQLISKHFNKKNTERLKHLLVVFQAFFTRNSSTFLYASSNFLFCQAAGVFLNSCEQIKLKM